MQGNGIIITILGSGTCVPSLKRSSCAVLATTSDINLLFDIGPGTMRRLLEAHTPVFKIPYLFLSHFHPDHSGELCSFLFARNYGNYNSHPDPLSIFGGKGLNHFLESFKQTYGHWIELDDASPGGIEIPSKKPGLLKLNGLRITSMPMAHNEESLAYRITNECGVSFVYSGDTGYNDDLVGLAKNTDLLICESSFPDDHEVPGHLTPSQAGIIAHKARARKLVLTHFYPECDTVDIEKQCRKTYQGPLILAEDLMEIHIGES